MLPALVFLFIWSTIVYNPIACWVWNPHGWAARLGVLDFAGGTPVRETYLKLGAQADDSAGSHLKRNGSTRIFVGGE